MAKIIIDPLTRVEGHLRIDTRVEDGKVVDSWCKGEMFRGFETLLLGRDPFDAPVITQRICGVCPVSHAVASSLCLEDALGIVVPDNGKMMRNLVLGANYLQSHILHFYQLSALDFINVEDILAYSGSDAKLLEVQEWAKQELNSNRVLPVAPFLPKLKGDYPKDKKWNLNALGHYLEALDMRQEAHSMAALFGGKMPHTASLLPGGVTTGVDAATVENFRSRLKRIKRFIEKVYLPDILDVARLYPSYANIGKGVSRFLSYGVFQEGSGTWLPGGVLKDGVLSPLNTDLIGEDVSKSYYHASPSDHPSSSRTDVHVHKEGAYTWIKAPRYNGESYEVGPLARLLVASAAGDSEVTAAVGGLLAQSGLKTSQLNSALGRHAARALEALLVAQRMERWLDALQPGQPTVGEYLGNKDRKGEGLTEAPRGALGHWISIEKGKIGGYQNVVPSTWNFSPRDANGAFGPVEHSLIGTPVDVAYQGLEVARVVRSFDPCIACAIH